MAEKTAPLPSSPLVPGPGAGRTRLGLADLLELPQNGKRYEILDGDLNVSPAPSLRHQRIVLRIATALLALQHAGRGEVFVAPVDVVLDPHTIVEPDVVFVSKERSSILGAQRMEGAPDLVVEVFSPSSRRTDVLVKAPLYARFGVRLYVVVDPDLDRLEVFRLEGSGSHGGYVNVGAHSKPALVRLDDLFGVELDLGAIFA